MRNRFHKAWVPLVALLALLLTGASWALSSPVGSSPDDDFHLSSIWCADGESAGVCVDYLPGENVGSARVHPLVGRPETCYRHDPTLSASCQANLESLVDHNSLRVNSGLYPSLYYRAMHPFVGDDVKRSVVLMRVGTFVGCVAILVLAGSVLRRPDRSRVWFAWLATSIPFGLFIFASINPSAPTTAGVAGAFVATYAGLSSTNPSFPWRAAVIAFAAALMAAGSRSDAGVFLVVAVLAALLLAASGVRGAVSWRTLIVVPVLLVGVVGHLSGGAGSVAAEGLSGGSAQGSGTFELLWYNLANWPDLIGGLFGVSFGLGWLETSMPDLVWFGSLISVIGLAVLGISRTNLGKNLSALVVLGGLLLFPLFVLQRGSDWVGTQVQPRYLLPLVFVLLATLVISPRSGETWGITRAQAWIFGVAMVLAQSAALHANFRRYTTGQDVKDWDLSRNVEWWWQIPISPMALWAVGTIAFLVVTVLVAISVLEPREEAELAGVAGNRDSKHVSMGVGE